MDEVFDFLTSPFGVVVMEVSAIALGALAVGLSLVALLRPPPDRKKRLQWARWEQRSADKTDAFALTNLIVWNGGPTIRDNDIAPLAPLEVVALQGAELDHLELIATNNPRNGVKVRRRTGHRTRSRIDLEYLNEHDGFVLQVRHMGNSSQIRLEGEIIGAPAPQWSGAQLARSWMHMVIVQLHRPRRARWRLNLQRLST